MIRIAAVLCLIPACVIPASCGLFGPSVPKEYAYFVRSGDTLNTNDAGDSIPVNLRIFLLKSKDQFMDSERSLLWSDYELVLKGSMIGDEPLKDVVNHGIQDEEERPLEIVDGVRFVGFVGGFNSPKKW